MAFERDPKHKVADELEQRLLGGLMARPAELPEVLRLLTKEELGDAFHQDLFEAICNLWAAGETIDLVAVAERIAHAGKLYDTAVFGQLAEYWIEGEKPYKLDDLARRVRGRAMLRRMEAVGQEIMCLAAKPTGPPDLMLEEAEKKVFALSQMGQTSDAVSIGTTLDAVFDRIDARTLKGDMGLETGWRHLDEMLCGLHAGEHIVVAARPGVGKTMVGVNLARSVAQQGKGVFIASLEMSREELTERLLVLEAFVPSQDVRKGTSSGQDLRRLSEAGESLRPLQVLIDDAPVQRVLTIAATARRIMASGGLGLVIVDYLQMVEPESRKAPRQEQVADISRKLKRLARELKVPVVSLAQLNRGPENRREEKPKMSDLRESGAIEADADVVILLHRKPQQKTMAVIVEKQRNGPVGEIVLEYEPRCGRLSHLETGTPFGERP